MFIYTKVENKTQ